MGPLNPDKATTKLSLKEYKVALPDGSLQTTNDTSVLESMGLETLEEQHRLSRLASLHEEVAVSPSETPTSSQ